MFKKIIRITKLSFFVLFLTFSLFSCYGVANATMISTEDLYKMSLQTGLRNCFNNYAKDEVSIYSLDSYEKFFNTGGDWDKTNGQDVWITTHIGNNLSSSASDPWTRDSNLSCEQLFKGYPVNKDEKEANGLLQYFQFPTIASNNMTAWGYWPVNNGATPDPGSSTTNDNKVKITITDIKSLDGNNNPLTSSGEIICSGVEGSLTSAGKGQYNWILNCEGEINAEYRGKKLYTLKASFNDNGRKWRAAYWSDGWVDLSDVDWEIPYCDLEDKNCDRLDFDYINMPQTILALQSAALNVHDDNYSNKSVLEILNGDARNQEGFGLTWILNKITDNVFKIAYNKPSFKINVEAVGDSGGGSGGSGGDSTNYKPIISKRTAAEIFAFNLGFNESLPHSEETIVSNGSIDIRYSQYIWNSTAKYSLYYSYLANMMKLYPNDININGCSEQKPSNGYYFKNKTNQWCIINIAGSLTNDDSVDGSILTYTHSTAEDSMYQLGKGTFGQVLEWFKKDSSYTGIPEDMYANGQVGDNGELDPTTPVDPGTPSTGDGDNCFNNAGALGWILCPVVSGLSDLGGRAYKWIENNFLQIRSSIFSDSGSGIRDAWDNVLTIANTGFIIVFLVVIFSQVTGFGIDNYGIKKLLPKLIVCAVLVNLSYIICELAVDLSNILGNGLNGLLTGMGPKLSVSASTYSPGAGQYIAVWGTGVVAVAIGMILAYGGLGAVMMLFLALLAGVVAIVLLFAVLVIRQAGVVVCVVAAPIAILCYLLPNTEKVYKKWFDLFKALLLVYPICGLVVGAGDFMSRIFGNLAGSSDNGGVQLGFALGAMIVQVLPFFFVPTILKGSLTAMGTVGAKIQGWGSKIGKGVTGRANNRVKNSTAFKNSQELAAERRTRNRAGIGKDGKARKMSGFGKFLRGGDRNMARARAQYLKSQDARNREENLMGVGFAAATIGQEKRAERDELADYMTLINNETRNGEDDVALGEMYNDYIQNGNKAGAVAVARIAGRRKDTAAAFLKNYVTNDSLTSRYNDAQREILRSVSKEVSTGENSGMYRESTPLGFEFAAQMNRGTAGTNSYNEWLGKQDERGSFANVHRAMENYITDTKQLVGVKGASLKEIGNLMGRDEMVTDENGNTMTKRHNQQMDAEDLARVSTLATQAIENRDKPGANWDSTKAEDLCRISGKYDYNRKTGEITLKPEYANAGLANGGAAEGENFNVREAGATVSGEVASGASVGGGNTEFNVRSMDDDTLLDLATSPGVPNNNSLRTVAEQEYARRNPGYVGGRANSGNGTGSGNGVNPGNNAANG